MDKGLTIPSKSFAKVYFQLGNVLAAGVSSLCMALFGLFIFILRRERILSSQDQLETEITRNDSKTTIKKSERSTETMSFAN